MKHGTWNSVYIHKCKCEECAQGRLVILQARRDARKGIFKPMSATSHGTAEMYWRGCRCEECKAANTRYQKDRRDGIPPIRKPGRPAKPVACFRCDVVAPSFSEAKRGGWRISPRRDEGLLKGICPVCLPTLTENK